MKIWGSIAVATALFLFLCKYHVQLRRFPGSAVHGNSSSGIIVGYEDSHYGNFLEVWVGNHGFILNFFKVWWRDKSV